MDTPRYTPPHHYTLWAQFGENRRYNTHPAAQVYCLVFMVQPCGERVGVWLKSIGGKPTTLASMHEWKRVPVVGSVLVAGKPDPNGMPYLWMATETARVVWGMLTQQGRGYPWSTNLADALEYARQNGWGELHTQAFVDDLAGAHDTTETFNTGSTQ